MTETTGFPSEEEEFAMFWFPPGTAFIDRQQAKAALENRDVVRQMKHLKPLYEAVRDFACSWLLVFHGEHEHPVPEKPWVVTLGDDAHSAYGPVAFHGPSLDALIMAADAVVLVAGTPEQVFYNVAATHAAKYRRGCIVIETRPEQQKAWEARLTAIKADLLLFNTLFDITDEHTP
jgi:hypothetical protein